MITTTITITEDTKNIKNIATFTGVNCGILQYIFVDIDKRFVTSCESSHGNYYTHEVIASNQKDFPVGSFYDIKYGSHPFTVFKNINWNKFYQQFLEKYAEYSL